MTACTALGVTGANAADAAPPHSFPPFSTRSDHSAAFPPLFFLPPTAVTTALSASSLSGIDIAAVHTHDGAGATVAAVAICSQSTRFLFLLWSGDETNDHVLCMVIVVICVRMGS